MALVIRTYCYNCLIVKGINTQYRDFANSKLETHYNIPCMRYILRKDRMVCIF